MSEQQTQSSYGTRAELNPNHIGERQALIKFSGTHFRWKEAQ